MSANGTREKVREIIDAHDQIRFDTQGGYPSSWVIEGERVYWADVDHDGAPKLTILSVEELISEEWAWVLDGLPA